MTCVCKNILSVKHILLECPITTELFQENRYDLNADNNVRDILYNNDVRLLTLSNRLFIVLWEININNNYMFFAFV